MAKTTATKASAASAGASTVQAPAKIGMNAGPIIAFEEVDSELGPKTPAVPGGKRPPKSSVQGSFFWIHGPPKVGKTTLAAAFEGVWFWATEPGQNWLEVYEPTIIHSWDHFLEMCQFVETTKPTKFGDGRPIKTICIDTVDLLFKMCNDHVSAGLGVEDPSELPMGKGWARLGNEFERVMTKIRRWPFTLICISHSRDKQLKTKTRTTDRIEPDIGAAGRRVLGGAADLILYAHTDEYAEKNDAGEITGNILEQRLLQCHPTSSVVAGGRMSHLLPQFIPLDYDELMAYLTGKKKVGEE